MSQTFASDRRILAVSLAAAAATVIAGIMHIVLAPRSFGDEAGQGILFLVGGALQVFWAVPVLKGWGRVWQAIGIVGTIAFTVLWFATHTHALFGGAPAHIPEGMPQGNLSHEAGERFGRVPPRGIASIPQLEYFQFAFIGLYCTLAVMISKRKAAMKNT